MPVASTAEFGVREILRILDPDHRPKPDFWELFRTAQGLETILEPLSPLVSYGLKIGEKFVLKEKNTSKHYVLDLVWLNHPDSPQQLYTHGRTDVADLPGETLVQRSDATWYRREPGTGELIRLPGEILITNYQLAFRALRQERMMVAFRVPLGTISRVEKLGGKSVM